MRKDDNVLTCRVHPGVQNLQGKHTPKSSARPRTELHHKNMCNTAVQEERMSRGPSVFTDLCPVLSSVPRHTAMKASGKSRPQFTQVSFFLQLSLSLSLHLSGQNQIVNLQKDSSPLSSSSSSSWVARIFYQVESTPFGDRSIPPISLLFNSVLSSCRIASRLSSLGRPLCRVVSEILKREQKKCR